MLKDGMFLTVGPPYPPPTHSLSLRENEILFMKRSVMFFQNPIQSFTFHYYLKRLWLKSIQRNEMMRIKIV